MMKVPILVMLDSYSASALFGAFELPSQNLRVDQVQGGGGHNDSFSF